MSEISLVTLHLPSLEGLCKEKYSETNIPHTYKKENKIFLIYKESQGDRLQTHIWLMASSYMVKYVLGSPSSYMTLQPIPSYFAFFFISAFAYLANYTGKHSKRKGRGSEVILFEDISTILYVQHSYTIG